MTSVAMGNVRALAKERAKRLETPNRAKAPMPPPKKIAMQFVMINSLKTHSR